MASWSSSSTVVVLFLALFVAAAVCSRPDSSSSTFQTLRKNTGRAQNAASSRELLLQYINRPFVTSFNLSDGTIVDCVRIQDQLGVQHPALKNHKILRRPSIEFPQAWAGRFQRNASSSAHKNKHKPWQLFHEEHGACPDGTIPVHRLLRKDLERMQTPQVFLRKYPSAMRSRFPSTHRIPRKNKQRRGRGNKHLKPPSADGHQYAIVQAVGKFSGSQAYLSVWDPAVASASDFSLSQLWLGGGVHDSINTVEAGWQVYELLNGDRSPHLFIFWTADSYKNSGCYNLRCPGFVQTSPRVLLGGAISSVSSPDSSLFFKKFLIFKDPVAWWLQIDDEWVGYWPASLFTTLGETSQWMQWGGEVCLSGSSDGPQLSTQMGSGFFPTDGNTRAASQCELSYLDEQMRQYDAVDLTAFSTDPQCYTAKNYYDQNWGSYIVFGGRGCSSS